MSLRYFRNGPARSLALPVADAVTTTINVDSASGFPTQYPYTLIIDPDGALEEAVDVSAAVGNALTVTRGVDSTTASAHAAGVSVVHGVTARDFREANEHVNATGNVHGRTGALVDTDSTQTIPGAKTFTGGLSTSAGAVVAVGGDQTIAGLKTFTTTPDTTNGQVVTLAGAQVITGDKTFTAPQPETVIGHFARKTANESVVGTITPQNDDHLSFPVVANAKYQVRLCLFWEANNPNDAKVGWNLPSGTFNMLKSSPSTNIAAGTTSGNGDWAALHGASSSTLNVGITDGSIEIGTELTCLLEVGVTGGTATVRWAQVAAGNTLTLLIGSWLHAVRVA